MDMYKFIKKLNIIVFLSLIFTIMLTTISHAARYQWILDPTVGKWKAIEGENVWVKDSIIYDDVDNDGIAYYYYIDEKGYMLTDTICPDYYIVDKEGRRLDKYGNVLTKEVSIKNGEAGFIKSKVIDELQLQVEAERDGDPNARREVKSEGTINTQVEDTFGPQLFVQADTYNGQSKTMLGKGVVLKEKEEALFDAEMDSKCSAYFKEGSSYSKSVNGTTFNKSKWKGVMALKGTGAYVDIENPKNNFNKITGRIATHYFTYSDRTTICTLLITDDNNEEIFSTSDFNYNGGCKFSVVFPRKAKYIRLELLVEGQYTTRVAYLRDLKFSFNKQAYLEEKEQDEEDAIIDSMVKSALNFQEGEIEEVDDSDLEEDDEEEEADDGSDDEYQDPDNDYVDPENIKMGEGDEKSGPSFDKKLKKEAAKKAVYGPGFDSSQYNDTDDDDEATKSNTKK